MSTHARASLALKPSPASNFCIKQPDWSSFAIPGSFLWFLWRSYLSLRDGIEHDLEIAWAFNDNG